MGNKIVTGSRAAARRAFRIVLICLGLVILMLGAGVAYVFFSGGNDTPVSTQQTPQPTTPKTLKPKAPSPDAPASVAVYSLNTPVAPGDNSSMIIHTVPTAMCSIEVVYNGRKSTDGGLMPKKADEYGTVTWSWTVLDTDPVGKWPIKVTCDYRGRTAVGTAELTVTR